MCIKDYIKQAKKTMNAKLTKKQKTMNCLLGLAGETGEVIDYFKKVEFQGHEYKKEKAIDEIGDVFWYLANLVDSLDLDIEEVLKHNIDKLQNRYPAGFKKKNSINREV
mgnify:CR=1 FL=1